MGVTLPVGSPKDFYALVYGRLLENGERVPVGLPMALRACYLRWHDVDLAKAAELLQDSRCFSSSAVRSWLKRVIVPSIVSAPAYGVRTAGDFFKAIQQATQLSSATHPGLRYLRSEMRQLSKEIENVETTRLANERAATESLRAPEIEVRSFVAERPDEQLSRPDLNSFSWKSWRVSFASVQGPLAADKLENQDAVFVKPLASTLVFALCDGVSTSYGARYGAARAAATFCCHLAQQLSPPPSSAGERDPPQMLRAAASHTQEHLSALLEALLENDTHEDWKCLRTGSPVQRVVERKLCENTRAPQTGRSWAPVLATTLVGGFVEHSSEGTQVHCIRVGDGVVELVGPAPPAVSLLEMNALETAIDSVLCPGPKGRKSVEAAQFATQAIPRDRSLVISSDGLIRGVEGTVSDELMLGNDKMSTAADILRDACDRADRSNNDTLGGQMYADNLSLFYMRPDEQRADALGAVERQGDVPIQLQGGAMVARSAPEIHPEDSAKDERVRD